jgi:hexosaminidase
MTMKNVLSACLLMAAGGLWSCSGSHHTDAPKGKVSIVPMPATISEKADSFLLDKQTIIIAANATDKKTAVLFNSWLKELTGDKRSGR